MSEKPAEFKLQSIENLSVMDKLDEQVTQYYLSLNDTYLYLFDKLLKLLCRLILGIAQIESFEPTYDRNSAVEQAVAAAACGCFRTLRICRQLLLKGYFVEMHAASRMLTEWLKFAVIVKACPEESNRILERGVNSKVLNKAKSNPEAASILAKMEKSFRELSRRAHATVTALSLIKRDNRRYFLGGIVGEDMFRKDVKGLAKMALNVNMVLMKHFSTVPEDWVQELREAHSVLFPSE